MQVVDRLLQERRLMAITDVSNVAISQTVGLVILKDTESNLICLIHLAWSETTALLQSNRGPNIVEYCRVRIYRYTELLLGELDNNKCALSALSGGVGVIILAEVILV